MKLIPLAVILSIFLSHALSLHFYIKHNEKRCFFEELPSDTLVVAKFDAGVYDDTKQDFVKPSDLSFELTVDETFDNDHRVVQQKLLHSLNEFTFTSLDNGEHKFCFIPKFKREPNAKIRVFLDVIIGKSNSIDSKKTDEVGWLIYKVNELNSKTDDIKREHANIREREASFRDQSEKTNARVVKWTVFQIFVLVGIGLWQLKHLKSFFIKEKVV